MKEDFAPVLHPIAIADLRPTQMTVGYREVARKRAEWRSRAERDGGEFLGHHMIPAVLGPDATPYIIDHHHLARALYDEGVTQVLVSVIANLGLLKKSQFWTFLDNRNWVHPFDAEGERRTHRDLPRHVGGMADDPYRSLAGELRRAGGYAKDNTPYSEFLWADFLRRRVRAKLVEQHFERAVVKALDLARGHDASYLPGWCGRSDDTNR
ncbi:MAG: chromosome partitioning protein ParB [Sphingomonas sp.]|uniref:ParB-like protein n=1 Tax=Sphingomonas sp. TaxID=28214 RepID=UPI001AC58DA9|nr:ParB-like protein [Sphingomonas sp.]MBN8807543.1 chromosome partitioning protein ParB [Sphingomonas sp.]